MGAKVRDTATGDLRRFMVSLDGLPHVCQILTAAESTPRLEIVTKFAEVKASTLDRIMDCLEEACGHGNVVVEGLDAAATQTAINKLMIPETSTKQETLERVTRHEARINNHIAHSRYVQAMKACQDGMAYIDFVCKRPNNGHLSIVFMVRSIFPKFTNIALKHAWCCLECGDHQSARQIMNLFLGSDPSISLYGGTQSMRSEAHFYYGLSLVAGGADNAAAFSFSRTLARHHYHEGANKALDAMEARLATGGSDADTIRVRQNLQRLKALRHGKVQGGYLSFTVANFLLSSEERESLTPSTKAILGAAGRELYIETLDSRPPSQSAFIFGGGVRVS